mgnify:CR=1 FL=1
MKKHYGNIVYDNVTNKSILIVRDEIYLIRDGKKMKVNTLIVNERKGN